MESRAWKCCHNILSVNKATALKSIFHIMELGSHVQLITIIVPNLEVLPLLFYLYSIGDHTVIN